ncbi:lysophospholipid acyltransferase family protein [Georgenia alba]|uniref:Lysophospholipid acyltransferase family protein n=1 Tax=Georgenia alba TaxID=2233858 RepID=A0ABW2Q7I8_9MICO
MAERGVSRLYRVVALVLRSAVAVMTRRTWRGAENLPRAGGFVAVANHVTDFDPLTFGHFLLDNGAPPHFMAKASLFEAPVVGAVLRGARQIPVHRGTSRAGDALVAAEEALSRGRCVAIFPEGTLTRDPALWPMTGRTGAARLALRTKVPVVPVAQWGAHRVLPRYSVVPRPFPPKPVTVVAGPPVDLDDLYDRPLHPEVLREATARIMAAITRQLAEIRAESPPSRPYDLRRDGDPVVGQDSWAGRRAAAREGRIVPRRPGVRARLGALLRRR